MACEYPALGVVLLIVLIALVGLITGQFIKLDNPWWLFFWGWLHIMAGIMWMGLLWYLNFVQTPTVPKIEPAEHRAAITKFIAPNVLFWFRVLEDDLRAAQKRELSKAELGISFV
jgi:uncharacterized membrane protein